MRGSVWCEVKRVEGGFALRWSRGSTTSGVSSSGLESCACLASGFERWSNGSTASGVCSDGYVMCGSSEVEILRVGSVEEGRCSVVKMLEVGSVG